MHVSCGELECVVEAFWFDFAVVADGACDGDVGDVFVLSGEHEVCCAFAVGVFHPVVLLYIVVSSCFLIVGRVVLCVVVLVVWWGFWGSLLFVHVSRLVCRMHPLGIVMPCE